MSFILYFVVRTSTQKDIDHELVTEDYYKQELGYQQDIESEKNAYAMAQQLTVAKTPEGLLVTFPNTLDQEKINGTVSLYRPSNEHLDFNLPISLSNSHMLIPNNRLLDGRWDITVTWNYEGKAFMVKKNLMY